MTTIKSISSRAAVAALTASISFGAASANQFQRPSAQERYNNTITMADCLAEKIITGLNKANAAREDLTEAHYIAHVNSFVPCFLEATGLKEDDLSAPPFTTVDRYDKETEARLTEEFKALFRDFYTYVNLDVLKAALDKKTEVIPLDNEPAPTPE